LHHFDPPALQTTSNKQQTIASTYKQAPTNNKQQTPTSNSNKQLQQAPTNKLQTNYKR
jgi:hypothetical protein